MRDGWPGPPRGCVGGPDHPNLEHMFDNLQVVPYRVDMPCVARHKITREKRVWRDRYTCDRWFKFKAGPGFDQAEWDITDDEVVPFWGSGMPHPLPDGTDGLGPLYDTPDFKPAAYLPSPAPTAPTPPAATPRL